MQFAANCVLPIGDYQPLEILEFNLQLHYRIRQNY